MPSTNAVYQATTQVTGQGLGAGGVPALEDTPASTPASTNAPIPGGFKLQAGVNQLLMPDNTYTFSRVQLLPMTVGASTNVKYLCTSGGAQVTGNWTAGSVTFPANPGGSLYVYSTGAEELAAAYS